MALGRTDLRLLEQAEELLSSPVRFCGMAHENCARDANGKVLMRIDGDTRKKTIALIPECSYENQHVACAHWESRTELNNVLSWIAANDETYAEFNGEWDAFCNALYELDDAVRERRVGTPAEREAGDIPDRATSDERSIDVLADLQKTQLAIEAWRTRVLGKVRADLGQLLERLEGGDLCL